MKEPSTKSVPAFVSIGPYSRLYSEDFFIEALAPLGMTRRSFRAWCRSLSVPMMEIGRTRLVDHLSVALALRAALRIGQPDFYAPSSHTLRRGKVPASARTSLLPEEFVEAHSLVISELLLAHRTASFTSPASLRSAALEASRRMLLAGLAAKPAAEQSAYARRAVNTAKMEGFEFAPTDQANR